MTTEHKDIEPVAYLYLCRKKPVLNKVGFSPKPTTQQVANGFISVPLVPQSAIDTLQAEKAALESQLQEARLQYISDFGQCQEHMETIGELRGVVAALEKQLAAQQWQPIETAPKEGTRILGRDTELGARETCWTLYGEGSPAKAQFDRGERKENGYWNWTEPRNNWGSHWEPTHWMPLPAAPAIANAKGAESTCKTCNGEGGWEAAASSTSYFWNECPDCANAKGAEE